MSRLFLAVPVTSIILPSLRACARALADTPLRAIPETNWHLTVAFLGDRERDDTLRVFESLTPLPPPAVQSLDRWAVFSSVVAIAGAPCPTLRRLEERARAAFPGIEPRAFLPHVSLARFRPPARPAVPKPFVPLAFPVETLVLYESSNGRYLPLSQTAL